MYDCTREFLPFLLPRSSLAGLDRDAYLSLATLCPNLQSLRLDLCGQITTDVISSWGDGLKSLRRIELYGPFLVRKEGWLKFFDSIGARAEGFLITQSPRIDLETVEALVKHCPNLSELRLSEVGQMSDVLLQPLSQLGKLQHLDLSSPGSPLSDDAVDTLLSSIGSNLKSLNLSNSGLADGVLPAIAKYCDRLEELFLRNLEDLSDEAVAAFFVRLASLGRPGLRSIDLEKGQDLRGNSLRSLIDHSGVTLERLSVLGWKEVDQEALEELTRCVMLKEVDLGWCREVTDFTIKGLLDHCEHLEVVRVWGEWLCLDLEKQDGEPLDWNSD
jgi:DNA repair protein RAD7